MRWGSAGLGSGRRATVPRAGSSFPIPPPTGNAASADMEHTRKRRGRKPMVRGRRCLAPQHRQPAGLLDRGVPRCSWGEPCHSIPSGGEGTQLGAGQG